MIRILPALFLLLIVIDCQAQLSPTITAWLQNTTATGSYYVSGNSNAIDNSILYNCQQIEYSADYAYISTKGVPAYPTGPFLDNNPSNATDQDAIFQMPLNPTENTGTPTSTTGGRIGVFINGVSLFDFRDGVGWNPNTNALCGGPGNPSCPGGPMGVTDWRRDAIPAEMAGFDCSKGHPAMGNYHHHQNPSAFKLDINVVSNICNLYDADGLYSINASQHSPLIGFTYDGFPIYGAYAYKNADGTGGITRIKSGYQLRNITTRTHWADGTNVDDGPDVSTTYFLGYFREDYEHVEHPGEEEYLDEHNGRFAVTPEYPSGTYAYFASVDEDWNSAYPYIVGPTFYGTYANRLVTSITESTTIYNAALPVELVEFRADLQKEVVLLSWITETEINNDLFTLERSTDGNTFRPIAKINGSGNTTTSQSYEYKDRDELNGTIYYRLKQTDFDGKFSIGKIVSVNKEIGDIPNVTIFPNPAADFVAIQANGIVRNPIEILLFDMKGNLLKTNIIKAGSTINYLDTQTIYNGMYLLQINDGSKVSATKIIISHD